MRLLPRYCGRIIPVFLLLVSTALAEPITFRRAVEAALKHSGTMAIAMADQTKSFQTYLAAKDTYLPSVLFGSGIGYSFGIPLTIVGTAPAIFNVTTQQTLYDPSVRSAVEAAKVDWKASDLDMIDKKNAIILDTAVIYTSLDHVSSKMKILRDAYTAAQRAQFISSERLKEGVDSELDVKKSQLSAARIQLALVQAESDADVLRNQLSKLTGFPAGMIETVTESVPQTPDIPQDPDLPMQAAENDPAVRLAFEKAKSAELTAKSEHNKLLPAFDFGSQYALLSTFNNYEDVYKKFTRNNYTVGVNIRFNFINYAQRAAAQAADADALKARKVAENAKGDAEVAAMKQQRALRQLAAARDVAKLEWEISQAGIDSAHARIESGQATVRDEELARLDANSRYASYLDASLDLYKASVQMLKTTGKIQEWALGSK
jgi:outer membrane protein TolC